MNNPTKTNPTASAPETRIKWGRSQAEFEANVERYKAQQPQHSPLEERLQRARVALIGDSNDEEHDALVALVEELELHNHHADKLADALRDCETQDGATAFAHPKYAPQRLRAINELVRAALAEYQNARHGGQAAGGE